MKRIILAFLFLCGSAFATSIADKSLEQLVAEADHVVIGTVSTVKMYGRFGLEKTNPKARTGPGNPNELRWTVKIDPAGILLTNKTPFPEAITIRLWKMWHMDLEGARYHEGKTYILLLKGEDMQWVYPGWFYRDLEERDAIKALLEKKTVAPAEPATSSQL